MKEYKSKSEHSGYKVPDGYFDELRSKIMDSAQTMQTERDLQSSSRPTLRVQLRSAAVFAASFAAMVIIAITGYYFTGYKATEQETMAFVSAQDVLLYSIDEYDMLEVIGQSDSTSNQLLAEASIDYFDTFGYPEAELLEK